LKFRSSEVQSLNAQSSEVQGLKIIPLQTISNFLFKLPLQTSSSDAFKPLNL
jgi:hypothetical protein